MPQRAEIVLSEEEREVLERWARRPKSSLALALRYRIVLAAADGEQSKDIAACLGCNPSTVGRWRGRFAARRLDGLHDEPRPGKPRSIVGLYLNPPDAAVVMCVDEKSQIQALDRSAPILPLLPGVPERGTHDYVRNGTTNLYAALDVASGQVIAAMSPRHRAEEFRRFLNLIDKSVPAHLDVHVVLDNSSTHKTPAIQRWLQRHPRSTLRFTPTYSSWLNLSSAGSPNSPRNGSPAAPTARSLTSSNRSAPGSPTGTKIPSPTSGTRPPTRSWTASPPTASGFPTQVTSGSPARLTSPSREGKMAR